MNIIDVTDCKKDVIETIRLIYGDIHICCVVDELPINPERNIIYCMRSNSGLDFYFFLSPDYIMIKDFYTMKDVEV